MAITVQTIKKIREDSLLEMQKLGYPMDHSLPLLEKDFKICRSQEEVASRALCLNIVMACVCGYPMDKGRERLKADGLCDMLSDRELVFMGRDAKPSISMEQRIESLWALAWVLGLVEHLGYSAPCSNELVKKFPDLLIDENNSRFLKSIKLRSVEEIAAATDLAYCLFWSYLHTVIYTRGKKPGKVYPYVISERRLTLEWLITKHSWDDLYILLLN